MAICEYCTDTLFKEAYWNTRQKPHHTSATQWEQSIKQCAICSDLLTAVRGVVFKDIHSHTPTSPNVPPQFKSLADSFVLDRLNEALPVYNVELREEAARDQFMLVFSPIDANVRSIDISGLSGEAKHVVLPTRSFQVFSTIYDAEDIPRLSNETSLDATENSRNSRTVAQVETWINSCNESHEHCKHFTKLDHEDTFIPTRLIEVGLPGQTYVRLVQTNKEAKFRLYASLSHCWGGSVAVCTYKENYVQHKKRIDLDHPFPQNFSDAIKLCRTLSIHYIWIDSLCIIQEDDDDWVREAPSMHKVYGSSHLNIAATSARNSTEGLFRKRRINLLSPSVVRCHWQGRNRYCKVIRKDFWSGELLGEPLYKRAWVAQERMLAPRTLNFGTKQLFWQCLTIAACETMPNGVAAVIQSKGKDELQWRRLLQQSREDQNRGSGQMHPRDNDLKPGEVDNNDKIELQQVWRDAVKNYTSCNITNTADKLPAVAGLAQVMHDCCQEDYVAGLWTDKADGPGITPRASEKLVSQFAWRVTDCKTIDGFPSRRQRSDEYRAPTWSWPSVVDGIIDIPRRVRDPAMMMDLVLTEKPQLKYKESESEPAQKFMSLLGGWVNATGYVYNVCFYDMQNTEMGCWLWHLPDVKREERPWIFMYPDEPVKTTANDGSHTVDDFNPQSFTILLLFHKNEGGFISGRALVVEVLDETAYEHIPPKQERHAMFARRGLVEFRKLSMDLWERFTGDEYALKGEENERREADGRIFLTLL